MLNMCYKIIPGENSKGLKEPFFGSFFYIYQCRYGYIQVYSEKAVRHSRDINKILYKEADRNDTLSKSKNKFVGS